jgi:hypothetical protein
MGVPFLAIKIDGKPVVQEREEFARHLESFVDGEQLAIAVTAWEEQRTLDQSGYFHAEPLVKWMKGEPDFQGLTPAQAKLVLLGMYFGYDQVQPGVWLPSKSSTSELTKSQFTAFIEWLIEEGNARGINVLPPERDPARRDKRVMVP